MTWAWSGAKMAGQQMASSIERRSGVSLWRQIADQILHSIAAGDFAENAALPPEVALAERYGVNRHTVRSAISALVQEGVLRAEQGRGTFVLSRKRLSYPIGARTRFSTGLQGQTSERHIVLLASTVEPASQRVAEGLGLARGTEVIRLETRGIVQVSARRGWFIMEPSIEEAREAFDACRAIEIGLLPKTPALAQFASSIG